MKKMIKNACAVAVMAASFATMAESTDMRVIGAISPAACTPNLSGNGTVDYGTIAANGLSADDYNGLPAKEISLTIACTAPAKVALSAISGRKGSALVYYDREGAAGSGNGFMRAGAPSYSGFVGFGLDGEKRIGAYALSYSNVTLDGKVANVTSSFDKTAWTKSNNNSIYDNNGKIKFDTWYTGEEAIPSSFETMSATVNVYSYLNKSSELDISKPIKLDGLTTLELVYL